MKKFLLLGGLVTVIAMAIFIGCSQPAGETDAMDEDSGKLPALTGSVSITGTKAVDGKLTAKTSALGGSGAIAYKWTNSKEGSAVIGTSPTYTVAEDDDNSIIRVTVSRAGYSGVKNASVTIGTVEPTPVVTHAPDEPWLIGEQGPAGGTVFFVNDDPDTYRDWDYLEAAPQDVPGLFAWASDGYKDVHLDGEFSVDIGKGEANTTFILKADPDAPAAKAATGYELNGFTDWFLPSSGELNAMYENRAVISGDFADSFYWSSSQNQDANDEAWYQRFDNGDIYYYGNKYGTHYVRPVRAFLAAPEPTDSPEPDPTDTPTATPSSSPAASPTASTSPTATPSGSPAASPTASASPTATPSGSPAASPTASASPTATPSGSPAASPTASASPTATPSGSPAASPTASASPTATPSSTPTPSSSSASIASRFDIDVTVNSADKVTDVFNALHDYIQNNPTTIGNLIKLGDYIDLHSLYVEGDTNYETDLNYGHIDATNTNVTAGGTAYGKLLRLIVVGINSFNGYNGNNMPHVVFHFQNIPGKHKMNNSNINSTGYLNSTMRKYLVPVSGSGGNFLTGLIDAGVPYEVLWAPNRVVASRGGVTPVPVPQTITDRLWLPTEREMFGDPPYTPNGPYSVIDVETAANQTSFTGFYTDHIAPRKNGATNMYWLASPRAATASDFCLVNGGVPHFNSASSARGVAPAFCVK
ncbi:hypothetical protein FACS1894190_14650 [Spirochaetia bacterium]|nr:hypothetical protein FACS1894190_14650 [Spirochaetia bacterium]